MKVQFLPLSPKNMISKYLEKKLTNPSAFRLSDEEFKTLKFEGVDALAHRLLKSKKYRKTSIDEDSLKQVKKAIGLNTSSNQPIKFTYPFGGYKIWRIPDYPEVGWAEFLTISYVLEYVGRIAAFYKPGVEIAFSSDDIIIELLDNYPREDLDSYYKSFRKLLAEFSKYLPSNVKISLKRVAEMYTPEEYELELTDNHKQAIKEGISEERIQKDLLHSNFNFQVNGKEDFSGYSEAQLRNYKLDLVYWSQAYLNLKKRREFVRAEDKIVLFSQPIPNAIDIGSTSASKAKFWCGIGVLEQRDDGKIVDKILSPKQWREVGSKAKSQKVNLIDMNNFRNINYFTESLNFRH